MCIPYDTSYRSLTFIEAISVAAVNRIDANGLSYLFRDIIVTARRESPLNAPIVYELTRARVEYQNAYFQAGARARARAILPQSVLLQLP